jgi:hypothetical protein
MLLKKAHFLSNPNRCIGGRKISIADDNFVALGAGSPEHNKTHQELNNQRKAFEFHIT